jgi:hypothetical protein
MRDMGRVAILLGAEVDSNLGARHVSDKVSQRRKHCEPDSTPGSKVIQNLYYDYEIWLSTDESS